MIRGAEARNLAAIPGGWCPETAWMPKLDAAAQDLWFVGQLLKRGTLRVAGQAAVGILARRGAEVDALYLAPDVRRKGLGRALMAEAMAAQDHLGLCIFAANIQARAFYAALGFAEVGGTDGDKDKGLPDVRLEWRRDGAAS